MGGGAGRAIVFSCPIPVKWPQMPLQGGAFGSLGGEAICPRPRYLEHGGEDSSPGPCGSLSPYLRRRNRLLEFYLKRWQNCSSSPLLSARDQEWQWLAPAWLMGCHEGRPVGLLLSQCE